MTENSFDYAEWRQRQSFSFHENMKKAARWLSGEGVLLPLLLLFDRYQEDATRMSIHFFSSYWLSQRVFVQNMERDRK